MAGGTALILALDSSTAACTAALFADDGTLLGARDEVIGRGHAERLVPMIEELLADAAGGEAPNDILVGVGPGSFTGLRVALAAAHGLAIGWDAILHGMPSLALLAASAPGDEPIVAALAGGHGELFVQSFDRAPFAATSEVANLAPADAAAAFPAGLAVGSGAAALVEARGSGEALDLVPSARHALRLPPELRTLPAKPQYIRSPDARPKAA
ncbi:tRNA (adenosine(37)-N6)-threonylcarbamoyltransferase complex dimerization subunit type 1 TsaB [Sphingomonas sp.]|uniref:tRNA (adenosine(37)-N6)-threonylcarbamoyltransferase complex dimerization subunit type 1 TsaB n=1 Tax=Sphingomonas sp. TaxID=28214 RepID=UPI0025CDF18E|nr:tRNA (adenosine(37)-N6)-threonylcarbamoyltransferase complex dimerization subunit type 1 TsaB [Sphingomonas sp.]